MKTHRKLLVTTTLIAALSLAGCWDGDDDDPVTPPAIAEVPDSAGISTAALIGFILGLSSSDESSEPATLKDTFSVPADETAEPTPLV